eukprot:CAMPEP_0172835216 /NCGR_PEP_ID=MMETSP1075-20121228/25594_1 /TAXON_ID=2916 /ORGANISM="Ceratium fusus, Strain PA161109" /LENGTH=39 /DNA_ID= /DNA_START= /DNA_END= /DNA_ORIENTATION=
MSLPAFLYMFMTSLTVYFGVGVPVPKKRLCRGARLGSLA